MNAKIAFCAALLAGGLSFGTVASAVDAVGKVTNVRISGGQGTVMFFLDPMPAGVTGRFYAYDSSSTIGGCSVVGSSSRLNRLSSILTTLMINGQDAKVRYCLSSVGHGIVTVDNGFIETQ